MTDNKEIPMTHTFQLMGAEIADFNRAFELSGFRSKSEFIRFCLFSGINDLYGEAK
jgi:hypothetical protein